MGPFLGAPAFLLASILAVVCSSHSAAAAILRPRAKAPGFGGAGPQALLLQPHGGALQGESCVPLQNQGSHFTVDVLVGTPGQPFSVVADTGSNSLIVPDCLCKTKGHCPKDMRCFTGTSRSSSFKLYRPDATGQPVQKMLSFGSGQILGAVAQDVVEIGGLKVNMTDGLLLMTDEALDIKGQFEGILGLGPPMDEDMSQDMSMDVSNSSAGDGKGLGGGGGAEDIQRIIKQIVGQMGGQMGGQVGDGDRAVALPLPSGEVSIIRETSLARATPVTRSLRAKGGRAAKALNNTRAGRAPQLRGFLEQANVQRFSMCFSDGSSGVLRLGGPQKPQPLGSIGKLHWGLDFRGISVGSGAGAARLDFCSSANMTRGQQTPCGAIPDSGTTLFMGPQDQIEVLLGSICDGWPRCAANFTKLREAARAASDAAAKVYGFNPWNLQASTKAEVVQLLLEDCDSWLRESAAGLDELPPLKFHVRGAGGAGGAGGDGEQALEIPAVDYVMAMEDKKAKMRACAPAFGAMDYPTQQNGPVWIMGLPLFFSYTVAYDIAPKPPTVAFSSVRESPCGSCDAKAAGLVSTQARTSEAHAQHVIRRHSPRLLKGAPRMPAIDVNLPL